MLPAVRWFCVIPNIPYDLHTTADAVLPPATLLPIPATIPTVPLLKKKAGSYAFTLPTVAVPFTLPAGGRCTTLLPVILLVLCLPGSATYHYLLLPAGRLSVVPGSFTITVPAHRSCLWTLVAPLPPLACGNLRFPSTTTHLYYFPTPVLFCPFTTSPFYLLPPGSCSHIPSILPARVPQLFSATFYLSALPFCCTVLLVLYHITLFPVGRRGLALGAHHRFKPTPFFLYPTHYAFLISYVLDSDDFRYSTITYPHRFLAALPWFTRWGWRTGHRDFGLVLVMALPTPVWFLLPGCLPHTTWF